MEETNSSHPHLPVRSVFSDTKETLIPCFQSESLKLSLLIRYFDADMIFSEWTEKTYGCFLCVVNIFKYISRFALW